MGDSRFQGPRVPPQETPLLLLCSLGLCQVRRGLQVKGIVFYYYLKRHIAGRWLSFCSKLQAFKNHQHLSQLSMHSISENPQVIYHHLTVSQAGRQNKVRKDKMEFSAKRLRKYYKNMSRNNILHSRAYFCHTQEYHL